MVEKQKKMSDLPVDYLTQSPQFTQIGLDVFGPWDVCTQRTRAGLSESMRWVMMITHLATRAVLPPRPRLHLGFQCSTFVPHG